MWRWVVAMALAAAGSSGYVSPGAAATPDPAPGARVLLQPNSYAQQEWCNSQAPIKVWSSRVGKGKSFGVCMDALMRMGAIPGYKSAITRLTRVSMRESIEETLLEILGPELFGQWWHSSTSTLFYPPVRCDDGKIRRSKLVLFGWQDPQNALSTQYGQILMEQAEQLDRSHLAIAKTRVRHGDPWMLARAERLGIFPQQIGLVCNADDPEHWINLDFEIEDRGMRIEPNAKGAPAYQVILSQAEDNEENLTDAYRDMLESMRGTVHYERLVEGRWVRAEGLVYGNVWNPAIHIIQRPAAWAKWGGFPPPEWPRHRAMDLGVNHPFTCAWYAERPDRSVVCYREIYGKDRAPSEWAEEILRLERAELACWRDGLEDEAEARRMWPYLTRFHVVSSVSDHELGWRKELERRGVWTRPAEKDILGQIATVTSALREVKIQYVSDLLVEKDPKLVRDKLPTSVLQEYGRYKWRARRPQSSEASDKNFDVPVDRDNHGLDRDAYFLTGYLSRKRVMVGGVA